MTVGLKQKRDRDSVCVCVYVCTCVCVCVCVHTYMHVCMCAHVGVSEHTRTCVTSDNSQSCAKNAPLPLCAMFTSLLKGALPQPSPHVYMPTQ